jgi:hypothetical protein
METLFKMKILFRHLSLLLLAFLVLQSCHFNSSFTNREEDKIDGEKVTNEFYTLMKGKEYSAAYGLFSYEVKRSNFTSKEEFTMTKENGEIKILGYRVNSDGFFAPEKK